MNKCLRETLEAYETNDAMRAFLFSYITDITKYVDSCSVVVSFQGEIKVWKKSRKMLII